MITKKELQEQVEDHYGHPVTGSVKRILAEMEREGSIVFWGCISEDLLNDRFDNR